MGKQGKHWDSVPVPNVTVADLKPETFDFFRKQGAKSKRLDDDVFRNFRITSEILYHPQIHTTREFGDDFFLFQKEALPLL